MANYDSGITWNSGSRWDAASNKKPKRKMANIKLNLHSKSDDGLHSFGTTIIDSMDGNVNFPTPVPDAVTFEAATATYLAALDHQASTHAAATAATSDKDAARLVYEGVLKARGSYVQTISDGAEGVILSSGFDVRATPVAIGDLPAPIDFLATMGDKPGEINLSWSPVYGANAYMIECREHSDPILWKPAAVFTSSTATVKDLDSSKTYAFHVAAVGAAGQGPWSDESVKMVP